MYGSDDSFSDSESELSDEETGAKDSGLNNSLNKGNFQQKVRRDSWFGASNAQNNMGKKQSSKSPGSFNIQDMDLDNSFKV